MDLAYFRNKDEKIKISFSYRKLEEEEPFSLKSVIICSKSSSSKSSAFSSTSKPDCSPGWLSSLRDMYILELNFRSISAVGRNSVQQIPCACRKKSAFEMVKIPYGYRKEKFNLRCIYSLLNEHAIGAERQA